jgi:hypothetical protein
MLAWFARKLASALVDGLWEIDAMIDRVEALFGCAPEVPELWRLVENAADTFAMAPDVDELVDSLLDQDELVAAAYRSPRIRRWLVGPAPEMRESRWPVPALATSKELATWLGIGVHELDVLADRRALSRSARDRRMRHYRYTWLAKRTGGHRLIEAPKSRLRTIQRYVLDGIVAKVLPHDAAHGFRTGRSVRGFAEPHVGRAVVIRVDLLSFFTVVVRSRVVAIFLSAGYPLEVSQLLAAICTHATPSDVLASGPVRDAVALARLRTPHLPQGAPTSGALANLAAFRLDLRVTALARAVGARYTRYADDLVLSGGRELLRAAPTLVPRLGAIAIEEGFSLNFRKTRVMAASDRQRVAGLVVNAKLAVARDELDHLRAILHNCVRDGPNSQNREGHADFRAYLLGRIGWVATIDPAKGARLRTTFERIRWDL